MIASSRKSRKKLNLKQKRGHRESGMDNKVNKKETATLSSFSTDDLSVAYGYRVCIDSDQGHKEGAHFKVGWAADSVHSTANLHPGMWDEKSWSIGGTGKLCHRRHRLAPRGQGHWNAHRMKLMLNTRDNYTNAFGSFHCQLLTVTDTHQFVVPSDDMIQTKQLKPECMKS